jgi:precorrin-2 dehydrogenase/sirohydrochlorin ferrochelatase
MPYYPVFLDLEGQEVLVVGGGEVAERKIRTLLTYGCRISVISHHLTPYLKELAIRKRIHHLPQESLATLMDEAFMVIAATDDQEANRQIASRARKQGLLVNAVDQPEDCNFIMPSIVKRGDLQVAISTAGKSPALAKKLRKDLETIFGPEYDSFIELLGMIRKKLLSKGQASSQNKLIFQRLVDSSLLGLIKKGDRNEIRDTLTSILGEGFPVEDIVKKVCRRMY